MGIEARAEVKYGLIYEAISQDNNADDDYKVDQKGTCWWWLRSPGCVGSYAAFVYCSGFIYGLGEIVNYHNGCVRPAMWIDLSSVS